MQEKRLKSFKSFHLEMSDMSKIDNGQISLEDFGQLVGMNLKNSNRLVKRVQMISWLEIEKKYAKFFLKCRKVTAPRSQRKSHSG